MSKVDLRVELAAYSHSFRVQVLRSATVRDIKHEITKVCPGAPRSDGQRIVWRGRFLRDEEKVDDIWKSPQDSHIVHLAVHPSAWSTTPPAIPLSSDSTHAPTSMPPPTSYPPSSSSSSFVRPPAALQPPVHVAPSAPTPSLNSAISYVIQKHQTAVNVLRTGMVIDVAYQGSDAQFWRMTAIEALRSRGFAWPSLLDEEYPSSGSADEGVKYVDVVIQGFPFLQLTTPNATPTPVQAHALKVLTLTFPIIGLAAQDPASFPPITPYPVSFPLAANTLNLNQRLQQLGIPGLHLAANQNPNPNDPNNPLRPAAAAPEIRAIPIRALFAPLTMLLIRLLLLLYVFSPMKRPLFGIMLSAWMLYEAWNLIRAAFGHERGNLPVRPAAGQPAAGAAPPGANAGQARPADQGIVPNAERNAGRGQMNAVLDSLACLGLAEEDAALDADRPVPPPGVVHQAKMFVGLLFLTLYPAAWDRRRAVLRRREGRIRTEANAREAQPAADDVPVLAEGEEGVLAREARLANESRERARAQLVAKHQRRSAWVREYVERAAAGEWADDS